MELLQVVALAVVQGVTEFLPIGADAHMALAARLLPPATAGLALALHIGAALAIAAYFASDIGSVGLGLFQFLRGRRTAHTKLAGKVWRGRCPGCWPPAPFGLPTSASPPATACCSAGPCSGSGFCCCWPTVSA